MHDGYPIRLAGGPVIDRVVAGPLDNNIYIVSDPSSGEAVIVDAADEAGVILAACRDLTVTAILTTHGHWDHVAAAEAVADALGAPIHIHPSDQAASGLGHANPLADGDAIDVGGFQLRAIGTPGHTPGSMCFAGYGVLFSGDTLFPGGPGATGDPDAFATIMDSLRTRLFTLPDDTGVFPGHGAPTTLGAERPSLDEWQERGW